MSKGTLKWMRIIIDSATEGPPSVIYAATKAMAKKYPGITFIVIPGPVETEEHLLQMKDMPVNVWPLNRLLKTQVIYPDLEGCSTAVTVKLLKLGIVSGAIFLGDTKIAVAELELTFEPLVPDLLPIIVGCVPTQYGGVVIFGDKGASLEATTNRLVNTALLAYMFAIYMKGIPQPSVGILSNGTERYKGTQQIRNAVDKLEQLGIETRQTEGNNVFTHETDIVVSSGLLGNVWLKSAEETVTLLKVLAKKAFLQPCAVSIVLCTLVCAFLVSPLAVLLTLVPLLFWALLSYKRVMWQVSSSKVGGSIVLGLDTNRVIVIGHGNSSQEAAQSAFKTAIDAIDKGAIASINAEFKAGYVLPK